MNTAAKIVVEHLDDVRNFLNRACLQLESWQVVSYTISVVLLLAYVRRMLRSDQPLLSRLQTFLYTGIRSLPWVKRRVLADLERARNDIEEEVHQWDKIRDFYKFLPERSLSAEEILSEARQYASMGERRYMEHYDPRTRETDLKTCAKVYDLFSHCDPHRSDAFPGVRKMEAEIVRMTSAVFHGGKDACGVVAGGGTEAMLLACLSHRNRAISRGIHRPEIIAPATAHPGLEKAFFLFGVKVVRVPVLDDNSADVEAMVKAFTRSTCMIVASAPNHVTGTLDPITKLAKLARRYDIPLHVDCTLGGFLLPFMEYCDYNVASFDFRLPGVASISIDLHRYGQCPRSCSVLLYRSGSLLRHQCFVHSNWQGGAYATPTLAGGRDGGAVATAWATMLTKGREGYIDACARIVEGTRRLADLLNNLETVSLRGSANICTVAFACESVDVYAVVERMTQKGWHVDALVSPVAARVSVTLSMCEVGVMEEFVSDLSDTIRYFVENTKAAMSSKTAAYFAMLGKVADRSLLDELTIIRLLAHYSIPQPLERRAGRTLSVEGRKMSMMASLETMKVVNELRRRQREKEKEGEPKESEILIKKEVHSLFFHRPRSSCF